MSTELAKSPAAADANPEHVQLMLALVKQQKATEAVSRPEILAASTLALVTGAKEPEAREKLTEGTLALQKGSREGVEATLWTQATTLNSLFHDLVKDAHSASMPLDAYETRMKLALRAQNQSARTMEIIADMKQGPKLLIAGQVNTAQQQIINNGTAGQKPSERIVRSAKNQKYPRARAREPNQNPSRSPLSL